MGRGKRTVPKPAPPPEHNAVVQTKCIKDFHDVVKAKGHVLVANGPWIRCTVCRRRSRAHQYRRWTRCDCLSPGIKTAMPETLTLKRFAQAHPDPDGEECTTNKRQRILSAQRVEHKRRVSVDSAVRREAWKNAGLAVPFLSWAQLQQGTGTPPISAHHSHVLIACGGYGGCLRCGSVASGQHCQLMENVCRRWCPPGSKGPIARLAKGRMPHPVHGTEVWPDGSIAPAPRLWKVVPPRDASPQAPPDAPLPSRSDDACSIDPVPAPPQVTWVSCVPPQPPAYSRERGRYKF